MGPLKLYNQPKIHKNQPTSKIVIEYKYGTFLVKTAIFDPEKFRNGFNIQNSPNWPSQFLTIVTIC